MARGKPPQLPQLEWHLALVLRGKDQWTARLRIHAERAEIDVDRSSAVAKNAGDVDDRFDRTVDQGTADADSHWHLAGPMKCRCGAEPPIAGGGVRRGASIVEGDALALDLGRHVQVPQELRIGDEVSSLPRSNAGDE